jgi:hypothetical protein
LRWGSAAAFLKFSYIFIIQTFVTLLISCIFNFEMGWYAQKWRVVPERAGNKKLGIQRVPEVLLGPQQGSSNRHYVDN